MATAPSTPDGINYNALYSAAAGGSSTPVSGGIVNSWNLPSYLAGQKLWFDTSPAVAGHRVLQPIEAGATSAYTPYQYVTQGAKAAAPNMQTPEAILDNYAALSYNSPDAYSALQAQLAQAGFMSSPTKIAGGWTAQTEAALKSAITQYSQVSGKDTAGVPVSFTQFLADQAAKNGPALEQELAKDQATAEAAATPPSAPQADPAELQQTAQSAAQEALGRNLTQAELNDFVSSFHSKQMSAFAAAQAGGTTYETPNEGADAARFVIQNNQHEYGQHEIQGYADAFLRMMGISNAPDVQVAPNPGG